MALHKLTFSDLKRSVEHALTHAPDSTVTSAGEIVNDALLQFYTLHEWQFTRSSTLLALTSGEEYIIMPENFGQLVEIHAGSVTQSIRLVTPAELIRLRTQGSAVISQQFSGAILWEPQEDVDELPRARLQLWPTPSDTVPSAFGCIYARQPAKLEEDTDIPDLPPFALQAFKAFLRGLALAEDNQANAAAEMQRAAALIEKVKEYDGLVQGELGLLRGGVAQFMEAEQLQPDITIIEP